MIQKCAKILIVLQLLLNVRPCGAETDFVLTQQAALSSWQNETKSIAAVLQKNSYEMAEKYDVVIIGGGIAGSSVLHELAKRKYKVFLGEKNTFASGASGNSTKLLHAYVRYLKFVWTDLKKFQWQSAWTELIYLWTASKERVEIKERVKELLPEKKNFMKNLPIIIPMYRGSELHPALVFLFVWVYYLLSKLSGNDLKMPQYWSAKTLVKKMGLKKEGLLGGFAYWDTLIESDRELVRAIIRSAEKSGAVAKERYEYRSHVFFHDKEKYYITRFYDKEARKEVTFKSEFLIDATGGWINKTRKLTLPKAQDKIDPSRGVHLKLRRKLTDEAFLIEVSDGRVVFILPEADGTSRVGTTDVKVKDPDSITEADIWKDTDYLIERINERFSNLSLSREDIDGKPHVGVRPIVAAGKDVGSTSRRHKVFYEERDTLISVAGLKITSSVGVAREVSDLIDRLQRVKAKMRTWRKPADKIMLTVLHPGDYTISFYQAA